MRSAAFEDERALWLDTAAKSPGKARPHNNFGHALKDLGEFDDAMLQFEWAIRIDPEYPDALNNLATMYGNMGRKDAALALLQKTIVLNPGHVAARFNLALRYYESGLFTEAIREYDAIIEINPYSKEAAFARQMLGMIQKQTATRR